MAMTGQHEAIRREAVAIDRICPDLDVQVTWERPIEHFRTNRKTVNEYTFGKHHIMASLSVFLNLSSYDWIFDAILGSSSQ